MITREELNELQSKLENELVDGISPQWRRAYEDAIHAINVLDAFVARSTANHLTGEVKSQIE